MSPAARAKKAAKKASPKKRPAARKPAKKKLAVMVTGANSSTGRALIRYLYYDDSIRYIVAVGLEPKPYFFDKFDERKFLYSRANITRERQLKNLFYSDRIKDLGIDAVAHLAVRNRPDESNPAEAHRLNMVGTRNMIEMSEQVPSVKKFVYRSSHAVYRADPMNPVFLDEEADLNFDTDASRWIKDRVDADLYCRTKMDSSKLNIVVLRFSNIVGRGIHQYMSMYLNSRVPMHPMGFDPMVNLLHPRDAVRAIELALARPELKGVFNIPGKETGPLSVIARVNGHESRALPSGLLLRAAYRIQRVFRTTDFHYDVDPNRLIYPVLLDGTKAREKLGYEPLNHVELG